MAWICFLDAWKKVKHMFSKMLVKDGDLEWYKMKNQVKHIQNHVPNLYMVSIFSILGL